MRAYALRPWELNNKSHRCKCTYIAPKCNCQCIYNASFIKITAKCKLKRRNRPNETNSPIHVRNTSFNSQPESPTFNTFNFHLKLACFFFVGVFCFCLFAELTFHLYVCSHPFVCWHFYCKYVNCLMFHFN